MAAWVIDAIERFDYAAGELVAGIRPARHFLAKNRDQVQIAFGFPKNLLSANATGLDHDRADADGFSDRVNASNNINSSRGGESAKSGVNKSARILAIFSAPRSNKPRAQRLRTRFTSYDRKVRAAGKSEARSTKSETNPKCQGFKFRTARL